MSIDSERGWRFRGCRAALTNIVAGLDRHTSDRRVLIVLGVLVLSENITLTIGAGIALVLVGQALARYRGRPASEP